MATRPIPPVLDRMFRLQPGESEGRMATIDGGSAIGISRRYLQDLRCYADRPISKPKLGAFPSKANGAVNVISEYSARRT